MKSKNSVTSYLLSGVKKIPTRLIKVSFVVLIMVFFVAYLHHVDLDKLKTININWTLLALATLFALGFRYWAAYIWCSILRNLGAKKLPNFSVMADVYAKSWMGRYIPGTVTWLAAKVYMASSHGISKGRLAVSSILEGGMQVIAVLVVSLLILGGDTRLHTIPVLWKVLLIVFGLSLLIILYPPIFNKLLRTAYLLLKKQESGDDLSTNGTTIIRAFALYAFASFIMGMSEFFITRAVAPSVGWHDFLFIMGAFNLAGVIGIIAIFVPSGLGVRDGILLLLLSLIMPREIALAVTIASRLWGAFSDVLFYLIALTYNKLKNKRDTIKA